MKLLIRRVVFCFLIAAFVWCGAAIADRKTLNEQIIRMHVVANSDSEEDQAVKLQVRDAVLAAIQEDLADVSDIDQARAYLEENLPKIERIANETLNAAGMDAQAVATLCKEAFDTRHYATFSLPAGVYEALRITIGKGEGKNWWCVAFPSLCLSATAEGFEDAAVEAGLSDNLADTLSEEEGVEIRFFFLDALGKLENIFFEG